MVTMRTIALRTATGSDPQPAHKTRLFDSPPDVLQSLDLLDQLADRLCPFGPVAADRPLALYGAGNLGRLARAFLRAIGRDFIMAIDRNAARLTDDPFWSGVRVVHPDDVTPADKRGMRVAISVVTSPYVPLEAALHDAGFGDVAPFYDIAESFRELHPLSNGWFSPPLTGFELAEAKDVLARWGDSVSRAHHLQFIAWRRLREEWIFPGASITTDDRYFIPEIMALLHGSERLLDAGAHHGSVIQAFLQRLGSLDRIVAVEPDDVNRAVLKQTLSGVPRDRVAVYDCALAERDGVGRFHEGLDYASQLAPTGTREVVTRRIDALGVEPTYIKLHLEGAELAALKGARETLVRARPLIAATVYHNADGISATASWLMRTLPDYRFLFRLHGWCGTGAVVYAIPAERVRTA
jgi:FkbM family methyltransferase